MMRPHCVAALASGLIILASCQTAMQAIVGFREPKPLGRAQLQKTASRYGIPQEAHSTVLDTSFYHVLRRMKAQDAETAKNHSQPLQAIYYNAAGQQQSYHINCYAGGFPNLAWSRDGILAQFPPAQQAPRDSTFTLAEHLRYLRPLNEQPLSAIKPADYTVVIYWNYFMTRQSRRLIEAVQQNVALAPAGTRIEMVFVNNDSFYHHIYQQANQRTDQ